MVKWLSTPSTVKRNVRMRLQLATMLHEAQEFDAKLLRRVYVSSFVHFIYFLSSINKIRTYLGTPHIARCGPCMMWHIYTPQTKLSLARRNVPGEPWGLAAPQPQDVAHNATEDMFESYFQRLEDEHPNSIREE